MPLNQQTAAVVVAIIGALSAVATGFISHSKGKESGIEQARRQVVLQVNVFNAGNSSGISGAGVRVSGDSISESRQTDSTGRLTLELPASSDGRLVKIEVQATGFEGKTEETRLQSGYRPYDIRLKPERPVAVTPSATPTMIARQRVFPSGPRLSGAGLNFSDWYSLCSELPPSARITNVTFSLSGDRRCDAWANCKESSRSENKVCYQFQMQGHNEWPAPGQASSEGILTVNYLEPVV